MSPTYTMSAHLCKQIYASWRQTHDHSATTTVTYNQAPERSSVDDKHYYHISTSALSSYKPYPPRSFSPQKRSMDSDRSDEDH
ncbi:hypothetical protein SEUCBS139899_006856 [Sporothrix eucalyptigena]|uniref:Uncharacterized protein n=1 Tax=Sporothrix eucalyptigena TaxID=1812306 RepID=A0ABP0BH21_9PEZI